MPGHRRTRRAAALCAVLAVTAATALGTASWTSWTPADHAVVDHEEVLEPWFDAAGSAQREAANVVVLGDSVSAGFGLEPDEERWTAKLQAGLRQEVDTPGCRQDSAGNRPVGRPAETSGPVAWSPLIGPFGRATDLGPGASVTWQVSADEVDLAYRTRQDGGDLAVEIDGRRVATRSTDTDGDGGPARWSSTGRAGPEHEVTVTNTSSQASERMVTVTGLVPYRGDRGRCVHVVDASRSGIALDQVVGTPGYIEETLALEPDLLMVALGFNDIRRGISPEAFGEDLEELVRRVRGMGYDGPVLLVGWFTPEIRPWLPSWQSYLEQMAGSVHLDGVGFVDLEPVLPPVEGAPQGIYRDQLHPAAAGQSLIAGALLPVLTPPDDGTRSVPQRKSPTPGPVSAPAWEARESAAR